MTSLQGIAHSALRHLRFTIFQPSLHRCL